MADIVQLTSADENACADVNALLAQLGKDGECSLEHLQKVVQYASSELWVATENNKIIGMATLALIVKPGGITAQLEDVVVDEAARGKGLGRQLCEKAIERAKSRGAHSIHLTSRPARVAANKLYQKLGFEKKETNVYRLKL
ncbi:GNAT family N-acetyltransferase [Candidatus Parcubacteria bacterium]|nr:MAG: GNAT family N-acetyltransferase [Candidatus Parcubacteria bacterium]